MRHSGSGAYSQDISAVNIETHGRYGPRNRLRSLPQNMRRSRADYIRFLIWEAASGRTKHIPAHTIRQKRVAEFGAAIRALHANGQLSAELDPAPLQLAILALATYPMAFAPITQLVTGKQPADAGFQRAWYAFLRVVGERLLRTKHKAATAPRLKRLP